MDPMQMTGVVMETNSNDNQIMKLNPIVPLTTMTPMLSLDNFPKDFYPTIAKKYSSQPQLYKHVYVTSPHHKDKKKKKKNKFKDSDESWFDYLNPFTCDDDYEDYDEDFSGSDESNTRRRTRLRNRRRRRRIILFALAAALALVAAKCLLSQLSHWFPTFFATTGRDEFFGNDQLYHDGIDLDRAASEKSFDNSIEQRSFFSPTYDETRIANVPSRSLIIKENCTEKCREVNIFNEEWSMEDCWVET
ncbi:CLUMA_CG006777, isoform A [Clunio marinus]|uniref:CLUMA_CG006777, isoform A n=1 Tax=Clunio marinus TaxID=568069 RepID=A0A1J1I4C2_9DIPT|nr:CLUMA_CG006777, isoform A [Clunio marinus]